VGEEELLEVVVVGDMGREIWGDQVFG